MPSKLSKSRDSKTDPPLSCTAEFERILKKPGVGKYVLRLFVTGTTPRSAQAIANIRSLCDETLAGRYDLEVIDIFQQPVRAVGEHIIAVPTLLKKLPAPARRMVGDFSNRNKMLVALGIRYLEPNSNRTIQTRWLKL